MRIVSGIRPSGELHIGNYLGAVRQFIALQETHECFLFIADLHALTEHPEPDALRERTLTAAIHYLALGIDPQKATLFIQSHVPAHAEASWLLATLAPVGELSRMIQYKEKVRAANQRGKTRGLARNNAKGFVNAGLLFYPVLMAADILLYRAEGVPIGEDQRQHLELARNLAGRFNQRYDTLFPLPEPIIPKTGARIMSLSDPGKKMSKSQGPESAIGIFDEPDLIRKKIQRAVTDSGREVSYDQKRKPALANLLTIYALFAGEDLKASVKRFAGQGYAKFKDALAELLIEKLSPLRERRAMLFQSPSHVRTILEQGAVRARAVSSETLRRIRRCVGID